jgi:hypothetical protein
MRAINLGILLGAGIAVVAAGACTSGGDSDPASNGSGGGTGTGATGTGTGATGNGTGSTGNGTGGAGTAGGGSSDPDAVACPAATEALLLDFAAGMGGAGSTSEATFGDFTTTLSGGTFFYPTGLTSDVSGENWHVSGDLDDYGGFGLFLQDCTKVDASAFKGIKLTISGDTGGKPITLNVGTASNEITSAWLQANGEADADPNFGRCTPTDNKYDGSCAAPSKQIEVTGAATTIEIPWAELTGGSPEPSVDPSEITFITWSFTPPEGAGTASVTPYAVDVVVDDIGFME